MGKLKKICYCQILSPYNICIGDLYQVLFFLCSDHWMLIILAPYAYYVCCCDPVNSELENREEIVAVIVNAFNLFLTSLPKPPEIPNNIEIVQPKVSNYDFNYFENL